MHDFMASSRREGLAVIMVSSELPEILGMSDRVSSCARAASSAVFEREGLDRRDAGARRRRHCAEDQA